MDINKLENKERLAELRPEETLLKIGLKDCDVVCDIGCGSGVFTIPAAKITSNTVYGIEISDQMVNIINSKIEQEGLKNIEIQKNNNTNKYNISNNSVDYVLLVTVFHEIEEKYSLLDEIKRIMKKNGLLIIIEFHDKKTAMGPPVDHRIGKKEVLSICQSNDFIEKRTFDLGENFYCMILNSNIREL